MANRVAGQLGDTDLTLLARVLARLRRELSGLRPLTPAERSFRAANHAYWSRHLDERSGAPFVLVEPDVRPLMLLENANMAATIAAERDASILFLLPNPLARRTRSILRSYPRAVFEHVVDLRGDLLRLAVTLVKAWRTYRTLRSPDDILTLAVDGITYGDLVYDTVLHMGYATVDRVDRRTLRQLWTFFYYRSKILDLMSRYRIVAAAATSRDRTEAGTLIRYLLRERAEIVLRSVPSVFSAKKYRSLADARVYEFRPEPRYVDVMVRRSAELLPLAEAYLKQRLANRVDPINVGLAFDRRKRVFASRQEFASRYGLDPAKPIAFVMLHVFNDHPHYFGPLLYRDYYTWFGHTIDVAAAVDRVNWVVKEHPASVFYRIHGVSSDSLREQVRSRSLTFLAADEDFNAASLPNLASAVVTCTGTTGLEYSALGIPCVLGGGSSGYGGLGLTIEPSSVDDYVAALRNVDALPRLTHRQLTLAKLVAYFYLHVMWEPRDPFFRAYRREELMRGSDDAMFGDAARILGATGGTAALDEHVRIVREFMRSPELTQYIDFRRFPLLREAHDGSIWSGG